MKQMNQGVFNFTTRYVRTDGWRGYSEYEYAVAGANDTGTSEDSPCNSSVAKKELNGAKAALKKAGIPFRQRSCRTSNVFCIHHNIIVPPSDFEKAKQVMAEYYKTAKENTRLLYLCNN